jgi:hypothetical protein
MAQWILKANGNVVPRRSCRPLNIAEQHSEQERAEQKIFDELIKRRWGTSINPPTTVSPTDDDLDEYQDDDEAARIIPDIEDTVDVNGKLLNQHPAYDQLINAEVALQLGDEMSLGRVTKRAVGPDEA